MTHWTRDTFMFVKMIATAATSVMLLAGATSAETFVVELLDHGKDGMMVFEPAFIAAQPGDTIEFLSTTPGHNVVSIAGMLPEGAEPFRTKLSEDFTLTVEVEGVYGIKCAPHYVLGMVGLIQVGDAVNLQESQAVDHPKKSVRRFEQMLEQVL
jgi:pseudoazurin